jgi:hypothetical protein
MQETALQRTATGLDQGVRELLLRVLAEVVELNSKGIIACFFRDRFGGPADYLQAIDEVWGGTVGFDLRERIGQAQTDAEMSLSFGGPKRDPSLAAAKALLLHAPEPDFRAAVVAALEACGALDMAAERITAICRNRGAPWALSPTDDFEYVGDEQVETELIRPALAAINRPEFAGGVKREFDSARTELSRGTPEALKQAIHEAGCSVESAMKVVLESHGVAYDAGDTASSLFSRLEAAAVVPRHMEKLVLVAMTPRNRRGGHGAGAQPHNVDAAEAEAIVAGSAGAITYLASCLR